MIKKIEELNEEELRFVKDTLLMYMNTYRYEKVNKETVEIKTYNFETYVKKTKKFPSFMEREIKENEKDMEIYKRKIEKLEDFDDNRLLTLLGTFLTGTGTCLISLGNINLVGLIISLLLGGVVSDKITQKVIDSKLNKYYKDMDATEAEHELLKKAQNHFIGFDGYYKKLENTIK